MEKKLINWNNKFLVSRQITQKYLWNVIKLLLAVVLTWSVISQTSFSEVSSLWMRIDYVWLVPSYAFFVAAIIVFALRSWQLIGRTVPLRVILLLTAIQTVVGNLVANVAGAASLVMAMRVKYGVGLRQGIFAVIIAKLADMLVLWILLIASIFYSHDFGARIRVVTLLVIVCLMLVMFSMLVIIVYRRRIAILFGKILLVPFLRGNYLFQRAYSSLSKFANEELKGVASSLKYVFLLSLVNIGSSIVVSYANFRMFGLVIELPVLLYYTSMTQLISWLPISVFGGLGVFEVSSLYILSQMGYEEALLNPIFVSWRLYFYILNASLLPILFFERSK